MIASSRLHVVKRKINAAIVASLLICGAYPLACVGAPTPSIAPVSPAALSVIVGRGSVKMPDGTTVNVEKTSLSFDPPEIREVTVTGKVPRDHASWYDAWDPWPGGQPDQNGVIIPNTIDLTPKKDEMGTLILGAFFRAFIPKSLVVTTSDGAKSFEKDKDYLFNADWGQIANFEGHLGKANESEITAKAKYATDRLDLVQVDTKGIISVKKGVAAMVCPALPEPDEANVALAGIHIAPWRADSNPYYNANGGLMAMTEYAISIHEIYPINPAPPVQPINPLAVEKSLKKLSEGQELRIAFMGASITVGAESPTWWADLWTEKNLGFASRVVVGLRQAFPKATVTPISAFKGATTAKYGLEMIDKVVIPEKADLLLLDFGGNDASGPVGKDPNNPPDKFKEDMRAIIQKAKGAGMEVMIVIGEANSPWLKNKSFDRWPAYRQAMLELANEENVAAADIAMEMANLATHGIPPFTQLHNCINHPGTLGHKLYADVILRFFQKPAIGTENVIRGEMSQPTQIPGKWKLENQPMPPLEKILREAKHNPRIYGLYAWAGEYLQYRDSIKKVGWRSYRCGGRGVDGMTDDVMRAFAEDDVEVMYCLSCTAQKPHATPQEDEAFIKSYEKDITKLLSRYGPNGAFFKKNPTIPNRPMRDLEIWNEPNFQYLITPDNRPQDEMEAERFSLYARLLPAAYKAVKAYSKDVNVVGFGAGGASAGDIRFIEAVNKANPQAPQSFDTLATHPYVSPVPPEADNIQPWGCYSIASSLKKIRAILADHGRVDAPIWYTEIGWPISDEDGGRFKMKKPTNSFESRESVSPELQGAYVCRLYALAQRLGVQRVHIMSVDDTDQFNSGFFTMDGTWRPSAYAVQTMIRLMPAPRLLEVLSDGQDGYYAYRFSPGDNPGGSPVLMLWNAQGPKIVEIPATGESVLVTDMVGHSQKAQVVKGKVSIEIGPLPMYLQSVRE